MLKCARCNTLLPNAVRNEHTRKMLRGAACSPLCKIMNQLITIDPMGCWLYLRPAFTWACRSYSIRGFLYMHYFSAAIPPNHITMKCKSINCTNPEHMVCFGKARIRRDTDGT